MNAPCMGCQKRASACHDSCMRYKEWRKAAQELTGIQRKDKRIGDGRPHDGRKKR